jgi:uncharacterized repeat protein (TIGR01451 family)
MKNQLFSPHQYSEFGMIDLLKPIGRISLRFRRSRAGSLAALFILSVWCALSLHLGSPPAVMAAPEGFLPGAYIVDLGQPTQTVANGLKPYGLVYELVVKKGIPVKWAIAANKVKDGPDFVASGKTYRASAFIVPAEFAGEAASTIATWKAQGVIVDGPIASGFNAPIYDTITNFPNAVLDFQNGSIAQTYLTNAGIPATATGSFGSFNTYRMGYPSSLTDCDDFFAMPHADPTWANHKNLVPFLANRGFVWAACHSVSVLERVDDPGDTDTLPDMNFLSHMPPALQDSKSLKLFGAHALPTAGPYQYATSSATALPYGYGDPNLAAYPIMQFLGKIDLATQNGSEQIYIPDVGAQWRNTTAIAVYDQSNTDAVVAGTAAPPASQVKAAKMAFGPAFGLASNGLVMYEAGHSHAKATLPDNISAQRAFLNFYLLSGLVRGMNVEIDLPTNIPAGATIDLATSKTTINSGSPAVQVSGGSGSYSYQWYSSCGGTFDNPNAQNPKFTAPSSTGGSCTLRVVVKDSCNRRAIGADTTTIPIKIDVGITKKDGITQVARDQSVPYTITVTNFGTTTLAGVQIQDRAFNGNPNGTVWASATPSEGTGSALNLSGSNDPVYGELEKSTYGSDELLVSNVSGGNFKNSSGTVVTKISLTDGTPNTYNWTGLNLAPGQSATLTLTGKVNKGNNEIYIANLITAQPIDANNVVLTDTDPSNNRYYDADKLFAPLKSPDLKVTKTHSPTTPKPGDAITYTVTVQNVSTSDDAAANVQFIDLVPSSIDVTSWSCAKTNGGAAIANTDCGIPNNQTKTTNSINNITGITGTKLSKTSGSNITTLTFTIQGWVTENIGDGEITNTATVQPNMLDADLNLTNNTAIDRVTIPTTDLSIVKSDSQTAAVAGEDITYQLTVKNNGPSTVTAFDLNDTLPVDLILKVPTISNVSSGSFTYDAAVNQGTWTGLNLAVGDTATLSFNTQLKPTATGTPQGGIAVVTNTAQILTTGVKGTGGVNLIEINRSNNTSSDTDEIKYQADLGVAKSDGVSFGQQNDPLTYTLKVTNYGPSTVTSLNLLDRVTKSSLSNTSFGAISQGSLSPANPSFAYNATSDRDEVNLTWTGLNLAAGQSATVELTATVAMANGNLVNTVIVAPPNGFIDTNPANNRADDLDTIANVPPTVDLAIQKDNGQTIATPGQTVTYLIKVINRSSLPVDQIKVLDSIPPDLINSQIYPTSGDYDPNTGLWTNIYLAPNGDAQNPDNTPESVATLILEGNVKNPPTQSKLTNTATVEPPIDLKGLEINLGNNVTIDEDSYPTVSVNANANLLLVKRITAINGQTQTRNGHDLSQYRDEANNPYDDNNVTINSQPTSSDPPKDTDKWPTLNNYLLGGTDGGLTNPGDELEYSIYFLSTGSVAAQNVLFCDRLPTNVSFIPTAFNRATPAPGGVVGDRGMLTQRNGTTTALTNMADGDAARYFPPGSDPTSIYPNLKCGGPNTNGAIVVNLGTLPNATAPGTPAGAFGFVRFKGRVK